MNDSMILKNIQKHISLDIEEKEYFLSLTTIKDYSKKELILRQGQICKKIYFVDTGSLRAFNINEDGKQSTIMFAIQDWWITDMNSYINQKPALLSIETIANSRLIELEFNNLEKLYKEIPKFERLFRILFQNAYIREQLRVLNNISLTTEHRYRRFVKQYPILIQQITQKQIASYLGVTPEFLSSIKNK